MLDSSLLLQFPLPLALPLAVPLALCECAAHAVVLITYGNRRSFGGRREHG